MKNTMKKIQTLGVVIAFVFSAQAHSNYSNTQNELPDNDVKSLLFSHPIWEKSAKLAYWNTGWAHTAYLLTCMCGLGGLMYYLNKREEPELQKNRRTKKEKPHQWNLHKNIEVTPSRITITSADEKLVHKALCCVERNMDNTEFSVKQLASDMGMTRMSLYRKLQSITGQSPVKFIRSIRLKRAAQLLKDTDLSIKEIAYMTGFNITRYFTKCFKEMFDMLPSEYGNAQKGQNIH